MPVPPQTNTCDSPERLLLFRVLGLLIEGGFHCCMCQPAFSSWHGWRPALSVNMRSIFKWRVFAFARCLERKRHTFLAGCSAGNKGGLLRGCHPLRKCFAETIEAKARAAKHLSLLPIIINKPQVSSAHHWNQIVHPAKTRCRSQPFFPTSFLFFTISGASTLPGLRCGCS